MKIDFSNIPEVRKVGVYAIHNKKNNKYYIGSSVNIYERLKAHKIKMYSGGVNTKMEKDISKIKDINNFEFLILETFNNNTITEEYLRSRELYFMKKYKSIENGYNINTPWKNGVVKDKYLSCKKQEKFERYTFTAPRSKDIKARIKKSGYDTINHFLYDAVMEKLEKIEAGSPPFM